MMDDLSPAVERALDSARKQAAGGPINAVHLFLALIEDDEGRAARTLTDAGGDLPAVRAALADAPGFPFELAPTLTGARQAAGARDETTITGEYLLLGLMRTGEPLHEPLRQAGVRLEQLIQPAELAPIPVPVSLNIRDPSEVISSARAVDVNANRAREALRVLDDYVRFILDDAILTEGLKNLRHEFAGLMAQLPAGLFDEARNTLGDVGTGVTTPGEYVRQSAAEVARINFKRLQEALRSLEEFGKVVAPHLTAGLEQVRYRAYTLERAVGIGSDGRARLENGKLYVLLTGANCTAALDWTIRQAADGGAELFQLREKNLADRELIARARNVRQWTREVGALFVMNDRPDIARLVGADGVHLGQDDMSVAEARQVVGTGPLIGVSTHSAEQVRRAMMDGASYIGVGPAFPSATKSFPQLAGLEFIREAVALTTLPAFVIGGINADTIGAVVAAGARRVAVSAAICQADEPAAIAARLRAALP